MKWLSIALLSRGASTNFHDTTRPICLGETNVFSCTGAFSSSASYRPFRKQLRSVTCLWKTYAKPTCATRVAPRDLVSSKFTFRFYDATFYSYSLSLSVCFLSLSFRLFPVKLTLLSRDPTRRTTRTSSHPSDAQPPSTISSLPNRSWPDPGSRRKTWLAHYPNYV